MEKLSSGGDLLSGAELLIDRVASSWLEDSSASSSEFYRGDLRTDKDSSPYYVAEHEKPENTLSEVFNYTNIGFMGSTLRRTLFAPDSSLAPDSPALVEMNDNLEKLEYKIQNITLPAYTHKVASLFTTALYIREDLNEFSTLQDDDTESRYRTAHSLNKNLDNFFDRLGPSSSDPREFPDAFHALAAAIIPHSNSPEGFANTKMHEMVARTYGRMVGIAYMGHSFEHLAKPGLSTAMKMIDEHGMTNMADYLADAVIWIHDDQKRGVIGARTIIEALIKRPEISQNSGENEKNQYDESMLARNEALLKIWKSTNLDPDDGGHNMLKAFLVQEGLIRDDERPGQDISLQNGYSASLDSPFKCNSF